MRTNMNRTMASMMTGAMAATTMVVGMAAGSAMAGSGREIVEIMVIGDRAAPTPITQLTRPGRRATFTVSDMGTLQIFGNVEIAPEDGGSNTLPRPTLDDTRGAPTGRRQPGSPGQRRVASDGGSTCDGSLLGWLGGIFDIDVCN